MTRTAGTPRRTDALAAGLALGVAVLVAVPSPAGAVARTQSFQYTGGPQSFVVPPGVASVTFDVLGAGGGGGAAGGRSTATVGVTPGETIHVFVGGAGSMAAGSAGGFNGGGSGGTGFFPASPGGSGGGASDVRRGGTEPAHRVIVAGGGGGAGGVGGNGPNSQQAIGGPGGAGGGATGGDGGASPSGVPGAAGGAGEGGGAEGGRGLSAGGNGTTFCGTQRLGRFGTGGGGGGGGGYVGGAGGNPGNSNHMVDICDASRPVRWDGGGGGGGSGLVPVGGTTVEGAGSSGHGSVVVTFEQADAVVSGATFYSDGTSVRSGPSGARVSVFATSAEPGFSYKLVSGRAAADSNSPCSSDVKPVNDTPRFANAQGVIAQTAGTLDRPAGVWQICFLAEALTVTAAVTYTVTG